MRLVTCSIIEILEWFQHNVGAERSLQTQLDIGGGFRVVLGHSGNSILVTNKDPDMRTFVVKLLRGNSKKDYEQFGKKVDGNRTTFGIASITDRNLFRAIEKGAFWLVIDEY